MISISEEFKKYNYTFNRSLSSDIVLPYQENDILLGVNELANGENFNTSLEFLQSNLMYLYSISKFANPDLPREYKGWMGQKNLDTGSKLRVEITGTFFRSGIKFDSEGFVDTKTLPYFTIENYDNTTHNFIFTYSDDTSNPNVQNLPVGYNHIIDLTENNDNVSSTQTVINVLTSYGFETQHLIFENGFQTLVINTLSAGGTFMLNKSTDTYNGILGDQISLIVDQGYKDTNFLINDLPLYNIQKSTNSNIDEINNFSVSTATLPNFQNLFLCSPTQVTCLSANLKSNDPKDFKFVSSTKTYGTNNQLKFVNINSSAVHENALYVCDNGRKNISKLNINGFTFNDTIRKNKFYDTEIIGGEGGIRDNYSFIDPEIVTFYKNNLYVLDRANQTFKVYDKDLGFVRNIRKQQTYKNFNPVKIKIHDDKFYWLNEKGELNVYDLDLNLLEEHNIQIISEDKFIDFIISDTNNNFYGLTTKNVYKYFLNSLMYIGKFNFDSINVENRLFKFFNSIDLNDDFDNIFLYRRDNGKGCFLTFKEDGNFLDLLSDYNFDIFNTREISIGKNEFASNFAYNKSLNKIIKNIFQLRNFIYKKAKLAILRNGELVYNGVSYFNPEDLVLTNYKTNLDNYIGTNEIFSRAVINRVLSEIFKLQTYLLDLLSSYVKEPEAETVYLGVPRKRVVPIQKVTEIKKPVEPIPVISTTSFTPVIGPVISTEPLSAEVVKTPENCLMLEPFPEDPDSYFILEDDDGIDLTDVILLEYALVPEN